MARIADLEEVTEDTIKAVVNRSVKDVHEVSDYNNFGIDSLPQKGAKGLLLSLRNKAHKILIGIKRKVVDRKAKPGETRLYNAFGAEVYLNEAGQIVIKTASGAILTMKEDGSIEINGNTKSAMTFEEFEIVWNNRTTHYLAHTHSNGGGGSPTGAFIAPLLDNAKDMTPAKSLIVKLGANP